METPPEDSARSTAIDDIFNDALDLEGDKRETFLVNACANDLHLHKKVTDLLKVADQASLAWLTTLRDQHRAVGPNSESARRILGTPPSLGRYDVLEWIDEGGMGAVYRAHHRRLDKVVAIKFLLDRGPDAEWLSRFQDEARLLARLDHPNIARVYDFDQERDVPFLVMEFIDGTTLEEILQKRLQVAGVAIASDRNSRTEWVVDVCRQIARAVHHAHGHQIVHLDLKPANVMITPTGVAKVLDFGIARTFLRPDSHEAADGKPTPAVQSLGMDEFAGTPQFMSPEQQDGKPVGPAADIWSLGCILYDCLLDSIPRDAVARADRDPSQLSLELPENVRAVVASCLNKKPECRPASADWIDRALQPAGDGGTDDRGPGDGLGHREPDVRGLGDRETHSQEVRSRRWAYRAGMLVLAITMVAALIFFINGTSPGPVAIEKIQDDVVRAVGPDGQTLWVRRMPARILINQRHNGSRTMEPAPFTLIQDQGTALGVLVATAPGTAPGRLWLLDPETGETIWSHEPGWTAPANDIGHPLYTWTDSIRWPGESDPVVLAGIGVDPWYPSAVEAISLRGETIDVYHHPGPLWLQAQGDFNNDGRETLLFSGINSSGRFDPRMVPQETDQHLGCLVVLDPSNFGGQGWPYTRGLPEDRDWPDLEPAREVAYLAIPLIHPDVASHGLLVDIGVQADGQTTIRAESHDGRMFFFDHNLRPRAYHVEPRGTADEYRDAGEATFLPLLYRHDEQEELIDVPVME